MQTILDILKIAGGWNPGLSLTIDNAPFASSSAPTMPTRATYTGSM
jgi:hypothetical protein